MRKPTTIVVLNKIWQKKKKTLWEYIYYFTNVEVEVVGTKDNLKCWILKKGLRSDCMCRKNSVLEGAYSLNDMLYMAQPYININYEEYLIAKEGEKI